MKVTSTVLEDFKSIVELFPDNVMVDLTRVKKATNGDLIVENETSNEIPRLVDIDDVSSYHSKIVREEVDAMASGQEFDIITIVVPRPCVELS